MASDGNTLIWRLMEAGDLASVSAVAAVAHPDFPEEDAVFVNRLALYGQGAHVLENGTSIVGYAITHPWKSFDVPALNTVLPALLGYDTYYIHDIALLDAARGSGAAGRIVAILATHAAAAGFQTMSLVAVNGSSGFWQKHGFDIVNRQVLQQKLRTYSDDACFMLRQLR
ncbi:GNAT family N-acetyltransferase [Phyllobacterium brassicacearum]|uniref:GNAT family N-acetyltransferase n=1 Tax=Phyllobacterium brassicacearum TaxID=314235 RepID=A0A2P7BRN0_9HYPH|nr:GNAT family N-acetyltransferase [Phyllobacterium brassicacearum]PSH69119.1 GNAT family N-acetyltransferase [Phyllobacterium brassicacearum]TDQ25375.1 L-amino acid N-acyltransferase YncA [Phyllobacterium brassicacearum]